MKTKKLSLASPGEILQENFLEPMGISQSRLASEIDVPLQRITEIVRGTRSISADIAHRLAHYFGMSERFWLHLQAQYDGKQECKLPKESPTKQSLRHADMHRVRHDNFLLIRDDTAIYSRVTRETVYGEHRTVKTAE